MNTFCGFFGDGLVPQACPTHAHRTRAVSGSCRHWIRWHILPCLLVACISGSLPFTAAGADLRAAAQNDPQRATAVLLDDICRRGQTEISGVQMVLVDRACNLGMPEVDDDQARSALQAMAWEEVATQATFSVEASNQQFANLTSRLHALRLGATGFDIRGAAFNLDDRVMLASLLLASASETDGAGVPPAAERLGAFISGTLSVGDKDATSTEDGFDFNTVGITSGLDYRFTDNLILGAAFSYTSQDADLDTDGDEVEADSYSVALYSTYYVGDVFLDFMASGGMTDYKMTRNIRYVTATASVDQTAFSDTDGTHYALALGGGYEFRIARAVFGPYGQINYFRADIDGFREQGAEEFNLEIGDQEVESLLSVLGVQISYPVHGAFGTLLPQLRIEWRHEFKNDSRSLSARLINDPSGQEEIISSDDPDRNYFNVAAGAVAALPGRTTVALEYETVLGLEDITNHIIRARLRVSF